MSSKYFNPHSEIYTTIHDLPHWHQSGKLQFVTFHLADSMPQSVLSTMEQEKSIWLKNHKEPLTPIEECEYHKRFSQFVDRWLDAGYGSCVLKNDDAADIMEKTLLFFEGNRYLLHSYVIMSNHVHILLETLEDYSIQSIMHSWKSFSAHKINKQLGLTGQLWRHDSFDRMIRDCAHYNNVKNYIKKNIRMGGVRWKI